MESTAAKQEERVSERAETASQLMRTVRRRGRRRFTAEDKIRIILEGVRKEVPLLELCRREGIYANIYYKWLKDFMEAGKERLRGDTLRQADKSEVAGLRTENKRLKEMAADLMLCNDILKKSLTGLEEGGTGG